MPRAIDVRCKTCKAEPGQWCVHGWGKNRVTARTIHRKRIKLARRLSRDEGRVAGHTDQGDA